VQQVHAACIPCSALARKPQGRAKGNRGGEPPLRGDYTGVPLSDFVPRLVSPDRGWPPLRATGAEWAQVVGRRARKLREAHGWTLFDLAGRIHRPDGAVYSTSTFSRLERGSASSPFYVFLQLARVLQVEPGRLLGEDTALLEASESELTLLRTLRLMEMSPSDALALLLQAR
jgi:transcriptional regulator with XRE-family HTH domain